MTESVAAMAWKIRVCYEDIEVVLVVGLLIEELLNLFASGTSPQGQACLLAEMCWTGMRGWKSTMPLAGLNSWFVGVDGETAFKSEKANLG